MFIKYLAGCYILLEKFQRKIEWEKCMKLYLKWSIFIALFSIGFLFTIYSIISSIEEIDLTIWFWIGLSLMSLSTILIFESKKATIALFLIFLIRLIEKPIRYSNLFGVDVWYHYGIINHIISSGTIYNSINGSITYYPTKGFHVLFSILTLFKIPLVSLLKFYHIASLSILIILLYMVSKLLLNNEVFTKLALLIFILADDIYLAFPQVVAIPIFLLSIFCVIKYFKCNDKRYIIIGFISFFSITFFHHFSTYFLVIVFLFYGILMLSFDIDKSKKLFIFSLFIICSFIVFMMIDKDLYIFTVQVFNKMMKLIMFHYMIIFFALTFLISLFFLNKFKPNFLLKINFTYIIVIAFLTSIAYFSFLASGVLIKPATKTAGEFLTDNIFKIFFLTISLSSILGMLQKLKDQNLFIISWFTAISLSSFLALYIRVLDLVRHVSYAYLPMSISAGALISLLENNQKRKILLTLMLLFIGVQPIIYSPLIHTQFRPGMTYELFSNEALSAARWIKNYTSFDVGIISDLRLSSLIYGYSQRNASFEWFLNSSYVFIDKPQIKYGFSSGYFGENRMLTLKEINDFHSPSYNRVYDSEEAYIFLNNKSEPFQIGTPYENRWNVKNIFISILLGIVEGFLFAFTIFCYNIGKRKRGRSI